MGLKITKTAQTELLQWVAKREITLAQVGGYPPEDLMESASDHLVDSFSRHFFMQISGFMRLLQVVAEENLNPDHALFKAGVLWLEGRFPQLKDHEQLQPTIEKIASMALPKPNLNITLKRITHVLTHPERLILCEALLNLRQLYREMQPRDWAVMESVIEKLLISPIAARELIERWQEKNQPEAIEATVH